MAVSARELGISIGQLKPGPHNAITDVAGVSVGHTTLIKGDAVRTGVTVISPHEGNPGKDPVFAGCHRLNGNGELTGLEWVRESGMLSSPVAITNTFSVGVVRDALCGMGLTAGLPVVGETWDGSMNDIEGMHITDEHVKAALAASSSTNVGEGNVGGGTGMICHDFKGGIGTSSRVVESGGDYTVGVLVQANHGRRERLRVNGLPVGEIINEERVPLPADTNPWQSSSIIVIVATDAPLLPLQCNRIAQRAAFGIAHSAGAGEHSSGDLILAFATGNRGMSIGESGPGGKRTVELEMLSNAYINYLFDAVIDATEEAILNTLLAAETMTGRDGTIVHALPPEALAEALETLGGRR